MSNHTTARANLQRAGRILEEARLLCEQRVWNLVVRRCQEVVELALKAALWWAGVEVPRLHDVGAILRQYAARFPEHFAEQIPRMASISRSLGAERERSFYGDEVLRLPPEELYFEHDAQDALEKAEFVLQTCRQLIEETE
jgi:HEPN domain-containing protein